MGSPMVFQTAPPQPASNARITCPPVLVGGPDASQKGFGHSRPQNFTLRSAIVRPPNCRSPVIARLRPCSRHSFLRISPGPPKKPGHGCEHSDPTQKSDKCADLRIMLEHACVRE